jgi:hypothetical protein
VWSYINAYIFRVTAATLKSHTCWDISLHKYTWLLPPSEVSTCVYITLPAKISLLNFIIHVFLLTKFTLLNIWFRFLDLGIYELIDRGLMYDWVDVKTRVAEVLLIYKWEIFLLVTSEQLICWDYFRDDLLNETFRVITYKLILF